MSKEPSILVVAHTPFQIVVACHVLRLYYPQAEVDLCISETIRGAKKLVVNARETNAFRNVIHLKNGRHFVSGKLRSAFSWVRYIIDNYKAACFLSRSSYDIVLFSNISVLAKMLVRRLKKSNPLCKFQIFEEGMSTYTQRFADGDSRSTLYRRFIDKTGVLDCLDTLYVFNPVFLAWKPAHGQIQELPKISPDNIAFRELINHIFDYDHIRDIYDKKLIFFEESHFLEGYSVPDVELVEKMADKVGKDNIMVKIHPRNPHNRFAQLGYKTNTDTAIPWEVIMLNQKLTDKILVTISSGSVIYPYLYFGIEAKSYSLIRCLDEPPGLMKGEMGKLMETVYSTYPNVFKAPSSFEEFLSELC